MDSTACCPGNFTALSGSCVCTTYRRSTTHTAVTPAARDRGTRRVRGGESDSRAHRRPLAGQFIRGLPSLVARRGHRSSPAPGCRATDDQAIGVLRAARELRIDVPGELAVAGFD
ncbi:substrate-binding domain-containing protein, partial [Streptomyces griseus]|uniref:substrate-binding domain-containing protein n=1 Tax=Streptomyces griseus TaxID=1911 RepID=UPI0033CD5EF9